MEWTDQGDCVRDFQRAQMTFHSRTCDAKRRGGFRHFQLPAALPEDVFEERIEPVHVPETEQPLDVAGEKRIQPLPIKPGLLRLREQRWR